MPRRRCDGFERGGKGFLELHPVTVARSPVGKPPGLNYIVLDYGDQGEEISVSLVMTCLQILEGLLLESAAFQARIAPERDLRIFFLQKVGEESYEFRRIVAREFNGIDGVDKGVPILDDLF